MSIHVEIFIRSSLDELWRLTQHPDLHARWDLRFTKIEYLPLADPNQPQRFLYSTRIGFGVRIVGQGETVGKYEGADGERSSALKFWSDDPKSLIREGSGYWRYVPTNEGVQFLTVYDYRLRYGRLGRAFDALVFRPLLEWATAWSFDRLRLWLETGILPEISLQRSLIYLTARASIAAVWFYQGLVPKLLTHHADEIVMIQQSGVPAASAPIVVGLIGAAEIVFSMVVLALFRQRWPLLLTILLMLIATVAVGFNSPQYLSAAFNPVSLNLLMIALAGVGLWAWPDQPSASRCRRKPTRVTP